jgi:hypothetical protein
MPTTGVKTFVPNLEHSVPANPLQFAAAPHYLADIGANVFAWRHYCALPGTRNGFDIMLLRSRGDVASMRLSI